MADIRIYREDYFYNQILERLDIKPLILLSQDEILAEYYNKFEIPKSDGTLRQIHAIKNGTQLYRLQKALKSNMLSVCTLPSCAVGFVAGKGYRDYLSVHTMKRYYLALDIKDFFGSIGEGHVRQALKSIVTINNAKENKAVIDVITQICLLNGTLPQGAVTSPDLSNFIFRGIDRRIEKYCDILDVTYTRYADDMLFSSNSVDFATNKKPIHMIEHILKSNGFKLNYEKTKISFNGHTIKGITIADKISFSKHKLSEITKIHISYLRYKKYVEDFKEYDFVCFINYEKHLLHTGEQLCYEPAKFAQFCAAPILYYRFSNTDGLNEFLGGYRAYFIDWLRLGSNIDSKRISVATSKIEEIMRYIYDNNL